MWRAVITIVVLLALTWSASAQQTEGRPGVGVDARGGQVIDPTENVKALNEAANKRQDDLRAAQEKLIQTQLQAAEKISELRYLHAQELATLQAKKLEDEAKLRADHATQLSVAEAKRIDAIRAVDVNAVAVANQRTSEQATALQTQTTQSAEVLRNQVARSAEDLRALVATTAATALQNQQQQFAGLSTRITTLEQAQSEGKGKQTIQDPAFTALLAEVRNLSQSRAATSGIGEGRSDVIGWIVGAVSVVVSLLVAGFAFMNMRSKSAR